MRVKLVGNSPSVTVLRHKLPIQGFVVAEHVWDYCLELVSYAGNTVILDGIACDLERHIADQISVLTKTDLQLRRKTGAVFSDNQLKIYVPTREEDENAVEVGVIQGLDRAVKAQSRVGKFARKITRLWRVTFLLMVITSLAQAQKVLPTGTQPTHVICDSGCAGGPGGGGTSILDTAAFTQGTTALTPIGGIYTTSVTNLASGQAGVVRLTADRMMFINLADYNGTAVGAGNAIHVQPGTAAVWDVSDRSGRALGSIANTSFNVGNFPATYDTSDRAARLLGVVYGSQAQQLKQTATNFNLQTELATGGTLYDARQIRALTSSDVVSAAQSGAPWSVTGTITPADAFTNPATAVNGNALHSWFNGSSWDRARSAGVGNIVAATGLGAQVPYCEFLTVLPVLTNGTYGAAQCDTSGRLLIGSIANTVTVSGTVTTTPPANASTNVAQFGGTNVSTGTGAGGAGIPRVTVSSDSQVKVWDGTTTAAVIAATTALKTDMSSVAGTATATAAAGVQKVGIVGNTGATLDAAPAAAMPTNAVVTAGRDSTQTAGGVAVPVICDKSISITAPAVASTIIIPLVASKTTYICGFVVTGGVAAGTMQWKSGTGTTCGTSTTNLTGAITTAIGGTISYGNGMGTVMRDAAAAQDTCITMATTSAAVAGVVTYAQF